MNELIRLFWNAAAITGAVLVGVFTHDVGFIALTFFGGLIVPRMLGLVPRRRWIGFACPKGGRWQRFDTWHHEAHGQQPVPPAAPPAATV